MGGYTPLVLMNGGSVGDQLLIADQLRKVNDVTVAVEPGCQGVTHVPMVAFEWWQSAAAVSSLYGHSCACLKVAITMVWLRSTRRGNGRESTRVPELVSLARNEALLGARLCQGPENVDFT